MLLQLQSFYDSEFGPSVISSDKGDVEATFEYPPVDDTDIPDFPDEAKTLPSGRRVIFAVDGDGFQIASAHLPARGGSILCVDEESFVEQLNMLISLN